MVSFPTLQLVLALSDDLPPPRKPQYSLLYNMPTVNLTYFLSNEFNCYDYGRRTDVFGPWIFEANTVLDFRNWKSTVVNYSSYENTILYYNSLKWERCYFSCEDYVLECSPSLDFSYFGPKKTTLDGKQCTSPGGVYDYLEMTLEEYKTEEIMKIRSLVSF